jgi:glycosyltransferase involved in cell wall biosynthesis
MKIGFASRWDPNNKLTWSGIPYNTWQQLSKYYHTTVFYYQWPYYIREYLLWHKQFQKLRGYQTAVEFLKCYARYFSRRLEKDLLKSGVDVLFCPGSPQLLAYCKCPVPIVYMTDAPFSQLQGYYHSFSNLAPYNVREGIELDKCTFKQSAHSMLASQWAMNTVIEDYTIATDKLSVVPFGANLRPQKITYKKLKPLNSCRLLFVGVEWERKGAAMAVNTLKKLVALGINAQLTIIGCTPPPSVLLPEQVTIIPYLNPSIEDGHKRLDEFFSDATLLFLPTKAECAGIVFCEAAAYGLPVVTTNTGGISTYVQNDITGYTLPVDATELEFAEAIVELIGNSDKYHQFQSNSRHLFEQYLNWHTWGNGCKRILEQVV